MTRAIARACTPWVYSIIPRAFFLSDLAGWSAPMWQARLSRELDLDRGLKFIDEHVPEAFRERCKDHLRTVIALRDREAARSRRRRARSNQKIKRGAIDELRAVLESAKD